MLRALIRRLVILWLLLPQVAAANSTAMITILEGEATLVRGATRYTLAEGVRLQEGDIVHTADKALVRLEFSDGAMLDLGPGVRLLTTSAAARAAEPGWRHTLLAGLIKLTSSKQSKANHQVATPQITLATSNAVAVLQASAADASLFVESGDARVTEGAQSTVRLKTGEYYSRKSGQKGTVAGRPPPAFVSALPRGFVDTIPARTARFKDRQTAPRRVDEVSYSDVEIWLKADRELRRSLMRRWQPRTRDPEFRSALVANLRHHPEWDPILFPEKYKPKEEKAPQPAATE